MTESPEPVPPRVDPTRLTVAFYDHETGEITSISQGTVASVVARRRPYVELPEYRRDWDITHVVINDRLTERPAGALAALLLERAMARLREVRAGLLKTEVDPLVTNPLRWAGLTAEQQGRVAAYRQALLDWPAAEADPMNPTPPAPLEL